MSIEPNQTQIIEADTVQSPSPQPDVVKEVKSPQNGKGKVIGGVSLILGIIACFMPIAFIGIACGIVGIVLSGRTRAYGYTGGLSIAGLIVSIIGLIIASFVLVTSDFLENFFSWWFNWMF